jgi:Domain of unknown function (DUF4390)
MSIPPQPASAVPRMHASFSSAPALRAPRQAVFRGAIAALVLLAALAPWSTACADPIVVKSAELRSEEDGYYLNAEFAFSINSTLDEALQKGVPLYFLLEFELSRPRWYWLDEKVISATTQYRVSYNALTRQYRIASGLFGQNYESLDEVERFLSRVTSREVARRDQLVKGTQYEAALRLRLDVNQLPKPFQMSALASREWTLQSEWHTWSFTP